MIFYERTDWDALLKQGTEPVANAILKQGFGDEEVTAGTFPFLTPAMLRADGIFLLTEAASLWPSLTSVCNVAKAILPLVPDSVLQAICDEINSVTGAQPPAATT